MIEVKRTNFAKRELHDNRTGKVMRVVPEFYECRYYHNGREIAWYNSKDDCIYLKTRLIGTDFKKTPYERALSCPMKDVYAYLFEMLGADATSKMSEYFSA